ncbi:disease resistance RPP13-like protein 4 [Lolium rigidum]|uniref:disease resistance RPP13-like protein 4 n=1 Tax=Lolium rigidum TaxID=89674 RepID=UPI001F5D307D|nr:disease resistance RPP13-like protein 4 [Lolium rigidum]
MAMVLDAFASYVQNLLTEMAREEVHMLLGVKDEIDKMDVKLGDLKNFLTDADRRNITDKTMQEWVAELKRAMYEAADILDLCQLKAMEQGRSTVDVGCFNRLLFCLRNPAHAHNIGTRIKELNKKLGTIKERGDAFNFIPLGSYEDRNSRVHASHSGIRSRETSGEFDRSGVVGEKIEEDTRAIVDIMLTEKEGNANIMVVAIVGVGGIGKKLFIVMDDVWSPTTCADVIGSLLANVVTRGSRILVTTRDEKVARGMKAIFPYHRVDKLEEDDGWSLLKNQIVSCETDGHEIDTLKDIGLQIVAKCDGLPLAIKVLGGLLCQKEKKRHEWKMVLDDSIWSVNEMPEELNHAVYLSYEDLPSCIKQCLLYYSLIPKTATLEKDDIVGMWIGEGILHGTSDNLEELGTKYYKELIVRNLIEPDAEYIDQEVCSMHDVVRSFAQFVSRDEVLAAHSGETNIGSKLSAHKFLRLSLENKSSESDGLDWSSLQTQTMLRTLILVGNINMKSGDLLAHFPSLRTLYADSTGVGELAKFLHEFKHLRYLSLENSDISSLPDNLGKLKLLQFISLFESKQFVKLPHSIVQLSHLRYLNFNGTSILSIPRGFHVLTNLRRVHGFPAVEDGDWCSLEELGPLYQLTDIGIQGLDNITAPSFAAKAKLGEKVHLTNLRLSWHSRLGDDGKIKEEDSVSEEEQEKTEKVFDELCPPPNLDFLSINGYFGRLLPTWMMLSPVVSLKTLRLLVIKNLACCTLLPNGLCQLPYLEFIQINRAPAIKRVGLEFLQSNHHQSLPPSHVARALNKLVIYFVKGLTYVENFASLVRLEVTALPDLERITNLARLQILIIKNCPKLKVLEGVPALQTLSLDNKDMDTLPGYMGDINPRCLELYCSLALLSSIAAGPSGPEWDKFRHVERVKAYAREGDMVKKWYVLYTANPTYNLETNVSRSFMSAAHHLSWPDSSKMDKIKSTFGKTHNLHNCCGVICTTHIPFGPNCYHAGVNGRILMQAVIDPKMRIMDLSLNSTDSITQLSIFQESTIFKKCEKGSWLNGSKMKEENLSDSKAEFNKRHSAATTCARKALAMLQEKWKCLQEDVWWPENLQTRFNMIFACSKLHNIVIDMEDDAGMPSAKDRNYHQQVRLVANEDAVRSRDMLSQYFSASKSSKSGVSPVDAEEDHEVAASGAGDEDNEQEAQTGTADEADNDIQEIIV